MKEIQKNLKGNDAKKMPYRKIKAGDVTATVWENDVTGNDGKTYKTYSFTLERSYTDAKGEWHNTDSMQKQSIVKLDVIIQKLKELYFLNEEEKEE